eukprot:CAMPEP_0204915370 /NCGR_PEP_ID=MMETSP1397-20131031/13383_1 /ASSEMBLY_ACC=CAM_ASM_000891 /TAXON_ID=49980 /ORGANISM="Climacostomum Climacostomum virens, Strain Stock W-24" /LENGTH=190 /DNA_ID=CAMNT_0052087381 /DNA_START=47 /DNA_END=619 /DNA_ORIENTATION=+
MRRSPFDSTNFIDDYIPPNYRKNPRLAKWDDPDYHWPIHIEPKTKLRCKALLRVAEEEYKEKIKRSWPEFHTGDIIEMTYYLALSTQTTTSVKGIVIGKHHGNLLNASFRMMSYEDGSHLETQMKFNSPMLKEIKVLERGNGKQRAKLFHIRDWPVTSYKPLGFSKARKNNVREEAKRLRQLALAQEEEE